MRLPWWPIYIDAKTDDEGVLYTTPDGVEHHAKFHQLLPQSWSTPTSSFWVVDERFNKVRHNRHLVILKTESRIVDLLDLIAAQRVFSFDIHPRTVRRQNRIQLWLMLFSICLLPVSMLMMIAILGYPTVPDNQMGIRFQNGFLIIVASMIFIIIAAAFACFAKFRMISRSKKLAGVTQDGISVRDSHGTETFIPYSALHPPKVSWGTVSVRSNHGQQALLPTARTIQWQIIKRRTNSDPMPSWRVTLWLAIPFILAGPLIYMWNVYFMPDETHMHEPARYLFLMAIGVFFVLNMLVIRWWRVRKQKLEKSESE